MYVDAHVDALEVLRPLARLSHALRNHDVAFPGIGRTHQHPPLVSRCGQAAEPGDPRHTDGERCQALHHSVAEPVRVDGIGVGSYGEKDDAIQSWGPEREPHTIQDSDFLPPVAGTLISLLVPLVPPAPGGGRSR